MTDDCPGSATDMQQCNQHSCEPKMVYWSETSGISYGWRHVYENYLPLGETLMDRCVAYCMSYTGCIGAAVEEEYYYYQYYYGYEYDEYYEYEEHYEYCFITDRDFMSPYLVSYEYQSDTSSFTSTIAIMESYYQANSHFFVNPPDGSIGSNAGVNDLCEQTVSGFGMVDYRNLGAVSFSTLEDKNIIRDSDSRNCAAKCFDTAGCTSFFVDDNGCNYIIGRTREIYLDNTDVTDSGLLHSLCPTNAFQDTFIRRSRFYCLIWAPDEAGNIADSIVQQNTGNADTPLGVWSFETRSNNPLIKSSQYVSIYQPDMQGDD